jgi:hypothetical protein
MLEKRSTVVSMRKLLILNERPLRTWPFARPQGAEKERGKTGVEGQKRATRRVAKSASRSEKPRQPWGVAGLIEMQRECLCKFYWWWNTELNLNPLLRRLRKIGEVCTRIAEQNFSSMRPHSHSRQINDFAVALQDKHAALMHQFDNIW